MIALVTLGTVLNYLARSSLSVAAPTLMVTFAMDAVGTATGMAGSIGWIGGALFTLVVGALADTVGCKPLFVMLAAFDLFGALILRSPLRTARAN